MTESYPHLSRTTAILAALAASVTGVHAQLVYSQGHADIGVAYEAGALEPHWHLHSGSVVNGAPLGTDTEYAPEELLAYVPDPSITRPPGAVWDFLGTAAGNPLWYLPQVQDPAKPYLGIASEELDPSEWSGLTLTLTGMTGPVGGQFSLWANGAFGTPEVKLSTADGISGADSFPMIVGSHDHYNWGFTEPGVYRLSLRWDGENLVDGPITASGTFAFGVTAVPEPTSTAVVMLTAMLGFAVWRRRVASR